jgi:hypothetical protein
MKLGALQSILARVQAWPKPAQDEALKALREIEEDFIIGPATRPEIDGPHQQALRDSVSFDDLTERLGT